MVLNNNILYKSTGPPQFSCFEEGRLVNVSVPFPDGKFSIWGFHDFAISFENSLRAQEAFMQQYEQSVQNPLKYILVAIGDCNRSRNNSRFYLDPLDQAEYSNNSSVYRANNNRHTTAWDNFFQN